MRRSLPSERLSTQVPIKVEHQKAKRKIRRKRVDLDCGCTYYRSLNCHNHGFTHRGIHHCSSSDEGDLLGHGNSPIFQDPRPTWTGRSTATTTSLQSNSGQPQPEESLGGSQMFHNLPDLDSFTSSDNGVS
ncbi:C2 protein [Sida yellow vein Madurai virus]|uniref:Transcriptional activator protein n=1 Tax=Sida yellow vein Madurai virus TaxID=420255 RepID=Q17ZQ9_9GEMI|nr:C2 protein [Sida yellow vein Madurai virus]CAJ90738.1 C2 protein [Sida yellow vein Madurai virus]